VMLPSVGESVERAPGNNAITVGGQRLPKLGWTAKGAIDKRVLQDMRAVVDTFTADGPVFDFTNSPGYFYYLLGEDPPTSYYHISMAVPEFSQEVVVDQLEKRNPALVVYHAPFGLPLWDGPHNEVRHFIVSQYLLDGWTPFLQVDGVIFLLRNDLVSSAPPLPSLHGEAVVDDVYFAGPVCDFGDSANFLTSEPEGPRLSLDVGSPETMRRISVRGWAFDTASGTPVRRVLVTVGGTVVGRLVATHSRVDVAAALQNPAAQSSGFDGSMQTPRSGTVTLYAKTADGMAHPLGDAEPRGPLAWPGHGAIAVSPERAAGSVDGLDDDPVTVSPVDVPPGTDLSAYRLAEFTSSEGTLGHGRLELSDAPAEDGTYNSPISAEALPLSGDSLRVRVGSCLQWHGYQGRGLSLTQLGLQHRVDKIVLSGVSADGG